MKVHALILPAAPTPKGQPQQGTMATMESEKAEVAALAARWVVEEGLDFGAAKRRALKQIGAQGRQAMPDNEAMERAVEEYIAVFCADTQPAELRALRMLALIWMDRLAEFGPLIGGAVWRGTATRHSDIYLQLFCEDPKVAEIRLIDQGVRFSPSQVTGLHGERVDALSVHLWSEELQEHIGLHLLVNDRNAIRGALQPDGAGRRLRGDRQSLRALVHNSTHE